MPHLILELVLWLLLAFYVGCIVGYFVHVSVAAFSRPAVTPQLYESDELESPLEVSSPKNQDAAEATRTLVLEALRRNSERPTGIVQARGGKPDNLQRISGIGPKNERTLHSLGFFHFDQIAGWSDEEVVWIDNHLKFNGRIIREEWILQAGLLAEGKEEEFNHLYGAGRRKNLPASSN